MDFSDVIMKRTSIRSYNDTPVTKEQMEAILDAGTKAPNACNFQSWHFYTVCDQQLIKGLHPHIAYIPWVDHISLVIVICVNEGIAEELQHKFGDKGRMFAYQDAAGAANYMLLKAVELGLGGCWIGDLHAERCKQHLSVGAKHTPVAILTIGTPSAEMPIRERKPLSEVVTVLGDPLSGSCAETQPYEASKPYMLAHASLPDAIFEDLNLSNASFCNINLQGAGFADVNMMHTRYQGLTMSEAQFHDVDMAGAEFRNSSFVKVEIEDCNIDGMTIDGIRVTDAIAAFLKNTTK